MVFRLETLAKHGKQDDICVCSHPVGGEMPLKRTRTLDSEKSEVQTVLENEDVGDEGGKS